MITATNVRIIFLTNKFLWKILFIMQLNDRIRELIQNEGISVRALEKSIGASDGVISKALRAGTDISAKWIVAISENYPQYNLDWLINGHGHMIIDSETDLKDEDQGVFMPQALVQMFSDMAATIRSQQEELRSFRTNQTKQ